MSDVGKIDPTEGFIGGTRAGELDADKSARLSRSIDDTGAQVFVTTTQATALPPVGDACVIRRTTRRDRVGFE